MKCQIDTDRMSWKSVFNLRTISPKTSDDVNAKVLFYKSNSMERHAMKSNLFRKVSSLLLLILALSACAPAPVFVVNSSANSGDNDPGDGSCEAEINSALCTLQAAIDEANGLPLEANVAISFAAPGTYEFFPESQEGLIITPGRRVTVTGATGSAMQTVIEPNRSELDESRIFTLRGSALELRNLTLSGGFFPIEMVPSGFIGGAIFAEQGAYFLQLENCIVENNVAKAGGAIATSNEPFGRLLIFDSVIRDNSAFPNQIGGAGGVHTQAGYVGIANTLFQNNVGASGALTVGSNGDTHEISGSTFYQNQGRFGGGIAAILDGGELRISRSTIAENHSTTDGGGLYLADGDFTLNHVTLVANTASSLGDGIYLVNNGELSVKSSVIDDNHAGGNTHAVDCSGGSANSAGSNVIEDMDPDCGFFGFGDLVADNISNHYGSYQAAPIGHYPLDSDSPAVDRGGDILNCSGVDQIGNTRPFDGDNNGTAKCDSGAIELHLLQAPGGQGKGPEYSSGRRAPVPQPQPEMAQIKADMLSRALMRTEKSTQQ